MTRSARHNPFSPPRGLTLVEILVSMAVVSVLFLAVATTFMSMLRSSEESRRNWEAVANGRAALSTFSMDVKGASGRFEGTNVSLAVGDLMDDDDDGNIDEEFPNGRDEDGDWVDQHAFTTGTMAERGNWVGLPDLGDLGIDEDNLFQRDILLFRLIPPVLDEFILEDIIYQVARFEERDFVLTRTVIRLMTDGSITSVTSPLAYDVLSFNCLYWNPNAIPTAQNWLEIWNSNAPPGPGPFRTFAEPASVRATLTMYADPKPISNYTLGDQVRTVDVTTTVNIERVIQDARFPRNPVGVP